MDELENFNKTLGLSSSDRDDRFTAQIDQIRHQMSSIVNDNKISQISKKVDDVEVSERRLGSQLQMVLEEQKKLLHSYYELDNKYKNISKENKYLRNEFIDLKKKIHSSDNGGSQRDY